MGGHNVIRMADLKAVFGDLGCREVRTYIQSGNVVFQSGRIDDRVITEAIRKRHGISPAVFVLDGARFRAVAEANPFRKEAGNRVHVFFFHAAPENVDAAKLEELRIPSEQYHVGDHAFYLFAPDGVARSKLAMGLHRAIKANMTARNLNTVNKLLQMLEPD